jgi:hypothetical protein
VRKSEVQVLSPAGTFLEGGGGAGVEPGRSIPSSEQVHLSSVTGGRPATQRGSQILSVRKSEGDDPANITCGYIRSMREH